jgi:hypothetical protein
MLSKANAAEALLLFAPGNGALPTVTAHLISCQQLHQLAKACLTSLCSSTWTGRCIAAAGVHQERQLAGRRPVQQQQWQQ